MAIAVGAAVFLFATVPQTPPAPPNTNQTKPFLTADQAIKLVPDKFFPNHAERNTTEFFHNSHPEFLFLKYNGTVVSPGGTNTSYPSFVAYAVEPSGLIGNKIRDISFDGARGKLFVNSTEDRYSWSFVTENTIPGITRVYVDAQTGIIVGVYNPCPQCVWKPYVEKDFSP